SKGKSYENICCFNLQSCACVCRRCATSSGKERTSQEEGRSCRASFATAREGGGQTRSVRQASWSWQANDHRETSDHRQADRSWQTNGSWQGEGDEQSSGRRQGEGNGQANGS